VAVISGISLQLGILCVQVAHQMTMKYGKEYADMCRRNGFETVNEKVNLGLKECYGADCRAALVLSYFSSTLLLFYVWI